MTHPVTDAYNRLAGELLPHHRALLVSTDTDPKHIDDIVFRRSEYLGGMCSALLAMAEKEVAGKNL